MTQRVKTALEGDNEIPGQEQNQSTPSEQYLENSCLCACRAFPCGTYAWGNSCVTESLLCLERAFKEEGQLLQEQQCAKYILEVLKVAIRAIGFFRHCEQSASARQHGRFLVARMPGQLLQEQQFT
eukprot:TRINITY_DN6746_c0_g1_i25.p1 TRINITY_DN6746_c0_g1~~TRINITY_DN6746_c0_g1_i25.p1  ORF type:complete len:126 (+),score=15.93 TRINITY_DN6746_c0_g1_i25:286-663(+)